MKIFFACPDSRHIKMARVHEDIFNTNILASYHYLQRVDLSEIKSTKEKNKDSMFLVDSGAFSALNIGAEIDINKYCDYLNRNSSTYDYAAALDVIGCAEKSFENFLYMRARGCKNIIPTFHVGEPWGILEKMIDQSSYVALGGMVTYAGNTDALIGWLARCFKIADNRAVFHGFGLTNIKVVKKFPFFSVDSSSWMSGYRFNSIRIYDKITNTMKGFDIKTKDKKKFQGFSKEISIQCADMGIEIDWHQMLRTGYLGGTAEQHRQTISKISIYSYHKMTEYCSRIHGQVTIPERV